MHQNANQINPFAFATRINRPLILDGAMGSLLQQKGVKAKGALWMSLANLEQPEKVYEVHKEYIDAGADIITTNTFRTNPSVVNHINTINYNKLVELSIKIAKDAANDLPIYIAGSNASAEDCYQIKRTVSQKELEYNHQKHIDLLFENGCHFILNETQSHLDEIKIICEHCSRNEIPYVMSLFLDENLNLLSGESAGEVIKIISDFNPFAIGFNCILPRIFTKLLHQKNFDFNWGTYLNCGSGEYTDENISCGIDEHEYADIVKDILPKSPSFIGACCGSNPNHIKEIKRLIDENRTY